MIPDNELQVTVNGNHNGLFSSVLLSQGLAVASHSMALSLLRRLMEQPLPGKRVVCGTEKIMS